MNQDKVPYATPYMTCDDEEERERPVMWLDPPPLSPIAHSSLERPLCCH